MRQTQNKRGRLHARCLKAVKKETLGCKCWSIFGVVPPACLQSGEGVLDSGVLQVRVDIPGHGFPSYLPPRLTPFPKRDNQCSASLQCTQLLSHANLTSPGRYMVALTQFLPHTLHVYPYSLSRNTTFLFEILSHDTQPITFQIFYQSSWLYFH